MKQKRTPSKNQKLKIKSKGKVLTKKKTAKKQTRNISNHSLSKLDNGLKCYIKNIK